MHTEQQIRPGRSFGAGSGFVKAGPMVAVALMATVLFLFIGAAHSFANSGGRADRSEDDHNPATSRAAIERFWTVYHGNETMRSRKCKRSWNGLSVSIPTI